MIMPPVLPSKGQGRAGTRRKIIRPKLQLVPQPQLSPALPPIVPCILPYNHVDHYMVAMIKPKGTELSLEYKLM